MHLVQFGTHGKLSGLVYQLQLEHFVTIPLHLPHHVLCLVVRLLQERKQQEQVDKQDRVLIQELCLVLIESHRVIELYQGHLFHLFVQGTYRSL